jgi:hypothetical protein
VLLQALEGLWPLKERGVEPELQHVLAMPISLNRFA